jgi:hypothetical protein
MVLPRQKKTPASEGGRYEGESWQGPTKQDTRNCGNVPCVSAVLSVLSALCGYFATGCGSGRSYHATSRTADTHLCDRGIVEHRQCSVRELLR